VPVQHLHTVAGDGNASINFMLASTSAVKLGTKIQYVKVSTTSTLLPPTWIVVPGGTVTSVV